MGELFFVFKVIVLTVALVVVSQIRLGSKTFEEKAYVWIRTSVISDLARDTAKAGAHASHQIWQKIKDLIKTSLAKDSSSSVEVRSTARAHRDVGASRFRGLSEDARSDSLRTFDEVDE